MKVLNFGSLNIDYVYTVEHFVRAGETLASAKMDQFPGGKGLNQSVAFARAGACVYHAGLVGKEGEFLRSLLCDSGVDTRFVRTISDGSCGHAIIQVTPAGENCILLYGGANHRVTEDMIDEVLSAFGEGDLLMLQNEINGIDTIIDKAHTKGMRIALNPSPFNEVITGLDLSKLDYLILNETEGCELTGKTEADEIINALLFRYPDIKIILTLGSQGSMYADGTGDRAEHGIFKVKAVDTTAAGDTFTGFFFTSIMNGHAPNEALAIASAASSIAVSRMGAAPSIPTMEEVKASGYLV
ncbi:MAG: ribokinase [Ruminococcaceae bacterium]|nr:ribokinase [Oscillospiraceae bacterium]